jgi:hypothetical protein
MNTIYLAGALAFAVLTSVATSDTAAAGSRTSNRAPAPRTATASNQGFSQVDVANQNKAPLGAKTDKLCTAHRCHYTHGDH